MKILTQIWLAGMLSLPLWLQGQEGWTLEECINYAQENNLTIKSAAYNKRDAEINLRQAQQARFPSFNISSSYNVSFGRNIDPTTNEFETQNIGSNNLSLSSGITLYNGNRINNFIRQSQLQMRENDHRVDQFYDDIALQVAQNYLFVLFAEERVDQARFLLNISQQAVERMNTLIEAGQNPLSDRYELEAQVARDQQALITAENDVEMALLNLKLSMELDPTFQLQIVRPEIDIPVTPEIDDLTFEVVYNQALSSQPMLKADALALESAEVGVDLAKGNLLPRLTLGGSVGTNYSTLGKQITGFNDVRVPTTVFLNGEEYLLETEQTIPTVADNPYFNQLNENLGYGFGLSLNLPLYNNYNAKAGVERARVNVLRTENQNAINRQNLKSNVQLAIADARAAKEQLEAAEKSEEALQIAYDNVAKQLELDAATTYDLTDARNRLDSAQLDALIAKYDYIFKLKVVDYYLGNEITLN
jgi:outer membrane protein